MRILLLTTALLAALVTSAQAEPGQVHIVTVSPTAFTPEKLHIKIGDRVKWVFTGRKAQSVRRGLDPSKPCKAMGAPNSGPKRAGQTYTYKFTERTSFPYFDEVTGCRDGLIGWIDVD